MADLKNATAIKPTHNIPGYNPNADMGDTWQNSDGQWQVIGNPWGSNSPPQHIVDQYPQPVREAPQGRETRGDYTGFVGTNLSGQVIGSGGEKVYNPPLPISSVVPEGADAIAPKQRPVTNPAGVQMPPQSNPYGLSPIHSILQSSQPRVSSGNIRENLLNFLTFASMFYGPQMSNNWWNLFTRKLEGEA